MLVYYCDDYVGARVEFDTTRKPARVAALMAHASIDGVEIVAPRPVTRDELLRIHDPDYVDAVFSGSPVELAGSAGLKWDPGLVRAVSASTGGCRDAAIAAWRDGVAGSLSCGLHHAKRDHGEGYCTFNGVALAALAFRDAGAAHVLCLDLDAHGGGGTNAILGDEPWFQQVDVAVDEFDRYEPIGPSTYDLVRDPGRYLDLIAERLASVPTGSVQAVVYNAGMDPHESDGVGRLNGVTSLMLRLRERLVFEWAAREGLPVAWVLAGGYHGPRGAPEDVALLHLLTVEEATRSRAGRGGTVRGCDSGEVV